MTGDVNSHYYSLPRYAGIGGGKLMNSEQIVFPQSVLFECVDLYELG